MRRAGHVNHSLFWQMLCPPKDWTPPDGALLTQIDADFGSLENMQKQFAAASVGVQGSGWGVRALPSTHTPWVGGRRTEGDPLAACECTGRHRRRRTR